MQQKPARHSSRTLFLPGAFILMLSFSCVATAQDNPDPERFREEVAQITERYSGRANPDVILFTGSSSIRMWDELENTFQGYNIINTGFGGSHASDLLFYIDELILQYRPSKVFIYEGDNDIHSGKSAESILQTMKAIIGQTEEQLPEIEIVLISAKPSISRWDLKEEYMELNDLLSSYAEQKGNLGFADVWDIMLNDEGSPREDIFLEDDLHMNRKGYDLWEEVILGFMD